MIIKKLSLFSLIAFLTIIINNLEASPKPNIDNSNDHAQYKIVVDAGSTGTRLHIFKIKSLDNNALPDFEEIYYQHIETGIATYINSQREINEHLSAIFNPAQRFCFQSKTPCAQSPLYFLTTGGVRILKPSQQKNLYSHIRSWLEDNSMFQNIKALRTLSGEEEAKFGWLTSFENEIRNNKPLGAYFELGGASLQYAYIVDTPEEANTTISVPKRKIHLKLGSWLGFGLQEATRRVVDYWHVSQAVCFPSGIYPKSNFDYKNCFKLFENYLTVNADFESHQKNVEKLIEQKAPIKLGAAFDYLLPNGFKVNGPGKFHDKLKSACALPWQKIRSNYFELISFHQIDLCANGTYILNLFSKLHLPKKYPNYSFNSLSWTRGIIIHEWLSNH